MDRDKSIIGQNAGTTAAALFTTLVNAGVVQPESVADALSIFDGIRARVFAGSLELAGAETVVESFAASSVQDAVSTYSEPKAAASRPGADVEIKFGKHSGKTIGQLYASGKDGVEYLEWAAANMNNDFLKKRICEFMAAA